jgi:hypothetical protein
MIVRRPAINLLFASLCWLVVLNLSAIAAPPLLHATVNELAPRPRRGAPEWIEVILHSRSTAIREGALEFMMTEWGETIYRYRTHDLVINSGEQRFRFMLPAATLRIDNSNRLLRLRFVEKSATTDLGEFPLMASQRNARVHVIAVVRPDFRAVGTETHPLWQAFRLERFTSENGPAFDTTPAFLDPADLPVDPLGFFPFDIVLIEPGALKTIREKSRLALGQWVNAGGSLCVMASRDLETEHVAALNTLASVDPQWKPVTIDGSGRVTVADNMAFARVNFGRMAVATEFPPDDAEQLSPAWRRACAFLWRFRSSKADNLEAGEKLKALEAQYWDPRQVRSRGYMNVAGSWTTDIGIIYRELMPSSVRVVPLGVLAALIGVFLILIGPGDWFILGLLRGRRFTWVLFPLVAVLITTVTVFVVQGYMGRTGHQGALTISDIGTSGRLIRETRFEFELPARQGYAAAQMRNALRLPIVDFDHRGFGRGMEKTDIAFQGQYPARFDYVRSQQQWSPELSRVTIVTDAPDTSGIKWDAFDPKLIRGQWSGAIASALTSEKGFTFDFFYKGSDRSTNERPLSSQWRHSVTFAADIGLGSILTQVSPNGSIQFDDLPIMEARDPSRSVLIAAKRNGPNIHVWRRLYLH